MTLAVIAAGDMNNFLIATIMESNDLRPSAALINREWYDSARNILTRAELGAVLCAAVEYVLLGKPAEIPKGSAGVVFRMITPALDSDIVKYRERCARNKENAQRKRAGASGSDSQRVEHNSNNNSNSNSNNNHNIKETDVSLSGNEIERERFLICGYFFSKGYADPIGELERFWSYYDSLGWRNGKGAPIVKKQAAAAMWRAECEQQTPAAGVVEWYRTFAKSNINDLRVWTEFVGVVIDGDQLRLRLAHPVEFAPVLESSAMPFITAFVRTMGCNSLTYCN